MVDGNPTIKVFEDYESFVAEFDKQVASGDKFIVYNTGAKNQCDMDGNCFSWCPDCDIARPSIKKFLDANAKRTVLIGVVMTKEEWVGVKTHPYKVHPLIKAAGVPSMVLFEGKQELHRVDDLEQFKNEGLMGMFFED